MITVQHDGRGKPEGRILRIDTRHDWRPGYVLRWDWAGKAHQPNDVMRYDVEDVALTWADETAAPATTDPPAPEAHRVTRASVLDHAREAVLRDRAATHGEVEESFTELARLWSVRLGVTVSAAQVAILLIDLKTVRAWHNPGHADNWDDMAGYAACGGEVSGAVRS